MNDLPVGQCASLACLFEVAAPKVGNVHRGYDLPDLSLNDFLVSGIAIGPAMDRAVERGVGRTVLEAMRATRRFVATNTNLGIVLLLAPLAAVPRERPLASGVAAVLRELTADDAADVYEAIRLAQPGGMGQVSDMDIAGPAPRNLLDAMRAAADRDLVARQYVTDFQIVFEWIVPWLTSARAAGLSTSRSIVHAQLQLLSREPDSLIVRKAGLAVARQASDLAAAILRFAAPDDENYERGLADLDFWMRSDGQRRNPGTTADLITAGLFAALREGMLELPWR